MISRIAYERLLRFGLRDHNLTRNYMGQPRAIERRRQPVAPGKGRFMALTFLISVAASINAAAQITAQDNYDPYIRDRFTIRAIDQNTVFGDRTDINTGTTNFYVTVASLSGNNELEVALRYKYVRDRWAINPQWRWERDDPYMAGDFSKNAGWVLGREYVMSSLRSTARCSGADGVHTPPLLPPDDGKPGYYYPYEYFNGVRMVLPRGGGALLIRNGAVPAIGPPSQGGPYKWSTNDGWFFSCIPLKNGAGEGFLALAPDGTKYYFDDYQVGPELVAIDKFNAGGKDISLSRQEFRLYASRIEDRFGNYVEGLTASDGRIITTTDLGGGILRVNTGAQVWTVAVNEPFTITYTDGSKWRLAANWSGLSWRGSGVTGNPGPYCAPARPQSEITGTATVTVTTPSGASARFDFLPIQRGYSYVPLECRVPEGSPDNGVYLVNPSLVTEVSLSRKTVSGPGIEEHWTQMNYGAPNDCFSGSLGTCTASSPVTVSTKLTRSDGTYAAYTFGNRSYLNQGQLLKIEEGVGTSAAAKVTNQQWQLFDPVSSGYNGLSSTSASLSSIKRMVVAKRDIIQQGKIFTWKVASDCGPGSDLCVDQFLRPTKIIRSSVP